MKSGFYTKLATDAMKKNRRLYVPYLLACTGMILMYYIMASLSRFSALNEMSGGRTLLAILSLGKLVIALFAAIFLFYTNAFLVRRRNKEFGLYNILGMDKRSVVKLVATESFIIFGVSITVGLLLGILFSKLAELLLLRMVAQDIDYVFRISGTAVWETVVIFAIVSALLFLNSLLRVRKLSPIELLHSDTKGEKPPKANWVVALIGLLILGFAYYMAVSVKDPLSSVTLFFVAVMLVIVATYLLFIAGSVALCRLLQKNKKYYYRPNHFVSVSSMVYRMKRNGAGLASICILCTMVLVMISSTFSLYSGSEESMRTRYPRNVMFSMYLETPEQLSDENVALFKSTVSQAADAQNAELSGEYGYRYANVYGLLENGKLSADAASLTTLNSQTFDKVAGIIIVPLSDYNAMMGKNEVLADNEAMMYCSGLEYNENTIRIGDANDLHIVKRIEEFEENGIVSVMVVPSAYLVVNDFSKYVTPFVEKFDSTGDPICSIHFNYGFDVVGDSDKQIAVGHAVKDAVSKLTLDGKPMSFMCECAEENRSDFYSAYGGLFYIGIMLSIVFIFAAVLIIYYKQVSEGYEDRSRFEIMQKVGMTVKDIRKTVQSQVLTVFFLPILFAGLHLGFAFPMVWKCLQLFNLNNLKFTLLVTVAVYLLLAVLYALIYAVTSKVYLHIVGEKEKN